MNILAIFYFFVITSSFGYSASFFLKQSNNFLERNLMRIGIGLGIFSLILCIFNLFHMIFSSFDFIFWIIAIASVIAVVVKGIFWFSLIKGIFTGLGLFPANSYGVVQAAPKRQASSRDWLTLGLTVVGLIISFLGLLKS